MKTNWDTTEFVKDFGAVALQTIHDELHDEKKATHKYLSFSGSEYSYNARKQSLVGKMATNDATESALGGMTGTLPSI